KSFSAQGISEKEKVKLNSMETKTDELTCPICLEYFTDPVSLACDHNFCRVCITQYWQGSQTVSCTWCRHTFPQRGLKPNRQLRNIVESARGLRLQSGRESRSAKQTRSPVKQSSATGLCFSALATMATPLELDSKGVLGYLNTKAMSTLKTLRLWPGLGPRERAAAAAFLLRPRGFPARKEHYSLVLGSGHPGEKGAMVPLSPALVRLRELSRPRVSTVGLS
uniref:RING-type domain-containing protein n=1 Tax=Pelusios castaneus TaxID=367368 RepID=A0A8C8SSQ6_9SAUR